MKNCLLVILLKHICVTRSFSFLVPDPVVVRSRHRIFPSESSVTPPSVLLTPGSSWSSLFCTESYTRPTTSPRRRRKRRTGRRIASSKKEGSRARRFGPTGICHYLLDSLISIVAWPIATLLAKIIEHPPVRRALGQCIVSGFKDICLDKDLDSYLDRALQSVNEDLGRDAREAGQAFPTVLKEFVLGMVERSYAEEEKDYGGEES